MSLDQQSFVLVFFIGYRWERLSEKDFFDTVAPLQSAVFACQWCWKAFMIWKISGSGYKGPGMHDCMPRYGLRPHFNV